MPALIIGLTGGIASGKSTVSAILKELGAEVLDADLVAKEVVEPGTQAWQELVAHFGTGILKPDRTIDRKKLAHLAFSDRRALSRLNAITHPRIIRRIREKIAAARDSHVPGKVLVVDVPLLIETGLHKQVDQVWVVVVDEDTQLRRLTARNGLSPSEAMDRLRAQMPLTEKIGYADAVIDNSGSPGETRRQVLARWQMLKPDPEGVKREDPE